MTKNERGGHNKRGSYHNKQQHTNNPKRGAPGILFTVETGREVKARREGLEILQQDWEQNVGAATKSDDKKEAEKKSSASLDEELAMLNDKEAAAAASPFAAYDTGCRGTVFVLCTACRPIVEPRAKADTAEGKDGEAPSKKAKVQDTNGGDNEPETNTKDGANDEESKPSGDTPFFVADTIADASPSTLPVWNPLEVVSRVVQDMEGDHSLPSSRFITRMIPMQATCFAAVEDIQHTVQALLEPIVTAEQKLAKDETTSETAAATASDTTKAPTTFAIQEKRRICGHLKHDQIIDAVASVVGKVAVGWKVNLSTPDYTVMVEVCKTLAGISIVPAALIKPRNFNLAELRETIATAATATTTTTTTTDE